ncbi:hypothetical protein GX48_06340 [Paracoccidioides brasiliensis]|nr:hypothetical protein GX48_06340 [Paracoccidioides brasiliensis]
MAPIELERKKRKDEKRLCVPLRISDKMKCPLVRKICAHMKAKLILRSSATGPTTTCLRVIKLGSSSVKYEVGIFLRGDDAVKAVGGFTQVFVEKGGIRSVGRDAGGKKGMDVRIRKGLERLVVKGVENEGIPKL